LEEGGPLAFRPLGLNEDQAASVLKNMM